ncbi:MAG: hypothetical protein U0892_16870 [Pirellulales bacterium]
MKRENEIADITLALNSLQSVRLRKRLAATAVCIALLSMRPCLSQDQSGVYDPIPVQFYWVKHPDVGYDWFGGRTYDGRLPRRDRFNSPYAMDRLAAAEVLLQLFDSSAMREQVYADVLLKKLRAGEENPQVRAAMLSAASRLMEESQLGELWTLADEIDRDAVEAACVNAGCKEAGSTWRARLEDSAVSDQRLQYACDGLSRIGDAADVPNLLRIADAESRSLPVRMAAAEAIGRITDEPPLDTALRWSASNKIELRLMSVALLRRSHAPQAHELLRKTALAETPVLSRAAFEVSVETQPNWVRSQVDTFAKHVDSNVRRRMFELLRGSLSQAELDLTANALSDVNDDVGDAARKTLVLYAITGAEGKAFAESLIDRSLVDRSPAVDDVRLMMQSMRMMVELKYFDRCSRLFPLLKHSHSQTGITAAWAIRHCAEEPADQAKVLETAAAMASELDKSIAAQVDTHPAELQKLAHLLEWFGIHKEKKAVPILAAFVPKSYARGAATRIAGITALARIQADEPHAGLTAQLHERIADKVGSFAEMESVRFASTIALGILGDAESQAQIIANNEGPGSPIYAASTWALKEIQKQ